MSRGKSLIKNTMIISIGKICTSLITFFLLPLYTNILSPSEYGIVDLLNTLTFLLFPIITLQMEKAAFRELLENSNEEKNNQVITTTFFTMIFQSIIFLGIYFLISPFINNQYKVFLIGNVIAYIFLSLFQQFARGLQQTKVYAFSSFLSAALIIIFNIIFLVIFNYGVNGMLIGTFLAYVLTEMYLFFKIRLYKYLNLCYYKRELVKELLKYSIPLIPNALAWWVFSASDRLIVSSILGIDQNGILSASLKFSTIITTLYNIFDVSWTESISANINDSDISEFFSKVFNMTLKIFWSICLIMISAMPIVFPIMVNEKYNFGYYLVPISLVTAIFNVFQGLVAVVYIAKKNTKSIAKTSVISAIINAFVHVILIYYIGLYAAVISTFISFCIISIYRYYDINKKYFKINLDKRIFSILIAYTIILIIMYYINNMYINISFMCSTLLVVFVLNKETVKYSIDMLKKRICTK